MARAEVPCLPIMPPTLTRSRRPACGFTLIEVIVVMAIAAVLAAIAYPSLAGSILKVRRGDAVLALLQLQQAQERWRSNHARYGSLTELGAPARTVDGHYTLSVANVSATGYEATAAASGTQARDVACAFLQLEMRDGSTIYRSGPTDKLDNAQGVNRRCWNA